MGNRIVSHRFIHLLGMAWRCVQREARRDTEVGVARSGLLMAIAPHGNGTPMLEVGRALGLGPSTLTGLLDRAVEQDLVARIPEPEDRRAWRLTLTAAGTRERSAAIAKAHEINALLSDGFTTEELATVARWLSSVCTKLGKVPQR